MVLFFSKRQPDGARALPFLPRGFRVDVQAETGHPFLVPEIILNDSYEIAFYKMWSGKPLDQADRTALHLQAEEPDNQDPYGDRIDAPDRLKQARDLEYVGRFEEAAMIYERLGLRDEARRVRIEPKNRVLKTIQVDLNRLLDQIRTEGLLFVYRCPNCGASVESGDTRPGTLQTCAHCGTGFETLAVADFIRRAMS
jgi:DNA-directed RNA polymerase subunit RPC12/RpoP